MAQQFQHLFTPIKIGPVTVRNRIVSTPHGTRSAEKNLPTERHAYYHAERAKGGVGLIEFEYVLAVPEPPGLSGHGIYGYDERCIPGFRLITEMVHEHGAKIFCEVLSYAGWTGRGPSAMPYQWHGITSREATVDEIESWVWYYGITARNLREGGIDGVEIHASHGFAGQQFNSPLTNKRTDKYGGSLEKRLTFVLEVIDSIRREAGNDLALGVRLDVDEPWPGGITLEDGKRIARILEETGKVDYLSVDAALEPHQGHIMTAPMYAPHGHMVYCAAAVKEAVDKIPVIAAGRIIDPIHAEKILADGHADLVGMTRAQIAEPELANKAREGRLDDIRPCLGDNENCIGRVGAGFPIACTVNPAAGEEKELGVSTLQPAAVRKVVLVAGGGVAGMEAARTAALRGHRVILFEKEQALGGQVNLAALLPGRGEIGGIVRWLKGQLDKLGVEVHLGEELSAAKVGDLRPDAVVVATGAAYYRNGLSGQTFSPIAGWEQENVATPEEVLSGRKVVGEHVVIVDETGFVVGPGLGEWLADQGKSVEILTSDTHFGPYLVPNQQLPWVYARIMSKVTLTPHTAVEEIAGRTIKVVNVHTGQKREIEDVNSVVLVTAKEPDDGLFKTLKGRVSEVYLAGDCDYATNTMSAIGNAVRAGHRVGLQV